MAMDATLLLSVVRRPNLSSSFECIGLRAFPEDVGLTTFGELVLGKT